MATVTKGGSRVYPVDSVDVATTSADYHGSKMTRLPHEKLENRRSILTLEEARWTSMRKKIPGISGFPKTRMYVEIDPEQQFMEEYRQFVRQHFHQKECSRFVPVSHPPEKRIKDLKCRCGDVLGSHAACLNQVVPSIGTSINTERMIGTTNIFRANALLAPELQSIMQRQYEPPPRKLPEIPWSEDNIQKTFTCGYGSINFINVEHSGGKKPAKFIRMTPDDSIDDLIELMKSYWSIMEPHMPNLVISVVGGAKNFKLDGRMRDTFSTGLIKAAKTTSAWLISSGFNMGVMKAVGQAVRQGQSFCWDNDRMAHILRCIGIAPWGYVKNRHCLDSGQDGRGKFNAEYRTSNNILHGQPVPLNPDHTHFIFVDDGYRNRYAGSAAVRAKLEQKISQPTTEGGLGIPVVLVVVEGGTDALIDARTSLEHNIPVVVCAGTGRAADILAYAYNHTKTNPDGTREMKRRHEEKLSDKIFEAYGKSWPKEDVESKKLEIMGWVKICCKSAELMTIFHMNKNEDLDLSILSVLLKAKKGADEEQRLSQLKLALTWDRVDIAQEEIFREDVLWNPVSLHEVLTMAILQDKVKFVALILQQGVVMREFLTVDKLEYLYKQIPSRCFVNDLLYKLTATSSLSQSNVDLLLPHLLDRYDGNTELLEDTNTDPESSKPSMFVHPYKQLMLWAVLQNRKQLAKFCWEMAEEPVTSAIAVTRIYNTMAKHLPQQESNLKDKLMESKMEFEEAATKVIDECHHNDPDKAMMIVERKSPAWNMMTCLQIAASAEDQVFLSSVACQNSINSTWKHGIMSSWKRIMISTIFLPLIYFLEILSLGTEMTFYGKLFAFFTAPIVKFGYGSVMYVFFLVLHSYMVLVDFNPYHVTPIEIVVTVWIFTFFLDEIHILIAFPGPTIVWKLKEWYGLKWLDILNFLAAFIGFAIHAGTDRHEVTKIIYCTNSIIFLVRVMKMYTASASLGPKLVMIQRMVEELRMFIMVLMVFLLAYGVSSQGLLYRIRTPSWEILKDVIYFPYWQLYGEIELAELETEDCVAGTVDCRTFHWLVPFLLAAYLLVGNILLLNLLIAIFSHVFDTVEKNSIQIWKYHMYFLVMEFEKKPALIAPFSLFAHLLNFLRWLNRRTCGKRERQKQHYGKRHLEYLQLFEKEMMANHLRQVKAREMSSIETTVNKLQKRVDELTKLIEDEVIADHPNMAATLLTHEGTLLLRNESSSALGYHPTWPPPQDVLAIKDKVANTPIPPEYFLMEQKSKLEPVGEILEELVKEKMEDTNQNPEKHRHKHKKKHKKHKQTWLEEETAPVEKSATRKEEIRETKMNNINLPQNIQLDEQATRQDKDKISSLIKEKVLKSWLPRHLHQDEEVSDDENLKHVAPKKLQQRQSLKQQSESSDSEPHVSLRKRRHMKKKDHKKRISSDSD